MKKSKNLRKEKNPLTKERIESLIEKAFHAALEHDALPGRQ